MREGDRCGLRKRACRHLLGSELASGQCAGIHCHIPSFRHYLVIETSSGKKTIRTIRRKLQWSHAHMTRRRSARRSVATCASAGSPPSATLNGTSDPLFSVRRHRSVALGSGRWVANRASRQLLSFPLSFGGSRARPTDRQHTCSLEQRPSPAPRPGYSIVKSLLATWLRSVAAAKRRGLQVASAARTRAARTR